GEPRRSRGETVRTVAAERRAIGVLTAVRCGNRPALEATVAELSRREVGEVCTTLAGCVAGAAELADAELEELVDDLAPAAVRLIARQAAAVSHGDAGVDDRLGRWLEHAQPAEVKALVAAFAQAAWSALVLAAAGQGMDPEAYLQRLAAEVAAETAVTGTAAADPCPCRSGLAYGHCCGR
ncbi:MAG TPA: SEC-C domain-containing protein, partial [Acidimicrobiales bacterium]|nr:SEC-C domain-containing protein [Acidimicrobiales bacterium]